MAFILLFIIYLAFISLGLPDALLGAAWPLMYKEFAVPVSYAGIIAMIISACTIISSFQSDRLTRKFGTGTVTTISVFLTAVALFGFGLSHNYYLLALFALPYGLGAGSVDASLNNYVALHYRSSHMSWLHCMWGVGASLGPYILGFALHKNLPWNDGYLIVGSIQTLLCLCLLLTLPLWKKHASGQTACKQPSTSTACSRTFGFKDLWRLPGAKAVLLTFFCYSALEHSAALWGSSYLVLHCHLDAALAAQYANRFFLGITCGRLISGFIAFKLKDASLIRWGQGLIAVALVILATTNNGQIALIGLTILGFGCAPIYPSVIHSTPANFGADKSQALIGIQMGCAYIGSTLMPPLFGLIANYCTSKVFPYFLAFFLLLMVLAHESALLQVKHKLPVKH